MNMNSGKEIQKELKKIISTLETSEINEEELQKLKYLSDEYWDEVNEKRYEAIEEADILSGESDTYARSEYESLRQEIRNYDVLLQNKVKLQRIGYETFLKYRREQGEDQVCQGQ